MKEPATGGIPVTATCRVLKPARQPYYCRPERPVNDGRFEQATRANAWFDPRRKKRGRNKKAVAHRYHRPPSTTESFFSPLQNNVLDRRT